MEWIIILPVIVILSLIDYAYIRRKHIFEDKKITNLRGILPVGWKQIVCFIVIPISIFGLAWMLYSFYSLPIVYVLKRVCVVAVLWPIAITDYQEFRIPNKLILLGLALRIPLLIAELFLHTDVVGTMIVNELVAVLGATLVCIACMFLSRGSLGMGDLKLLMFMSLFLGIEGIISCMFVSIFFSAIIAIGLLIFRRKSRKDAIPFAPFVLAGTIAALILTGV